MEVKLVITAVKILTGLLPLMILEIPEQLKIIMKSLVLMIIEKSLYLKCQNLEIEDDVQEIEGIGVLIAEINQELAANQVLKGIEGVLQVNMKIGEKKL